MSPTVALKLLGHFEDTSMTMRGMAGRGVADDDRSRSSRRLRVWRRRGFVARVALLGALFGIASVGVALFAGATPLWAQEPAAAAAGQPPSVTGPAAPSGLAVVAAIEQALTGAIASAENSVVAIARVKRGERDDATFDHPFDPFGRPRFNITPKPEDADFIPNNFGAGVVIDRDGLILTNYHVLADEGHDIDDSDVFYVTTPARRTYKARKKAADPRSDLAVLAIDAHDLAPIKFGDGGALKKGQIVIALGNPYAIARDGQVSASWGIISNLSRKGPPAQR